jgi:hypothetical protein
MTMDLLEKINVPGNFKELLEQYGIERNAFEEKLDILVNNASLDNTVLTLVEIPSEEDFRKLFLYAYEGKNIDF